VFWSVEGGRDQPLRGVEGISRLSRKATVEKGRVPAYVTQTQREKCASTLPNSHPRPATQCARYHRQALGSHLRSWGDSRGAEARHCHNRLLPVLLFASFRPSFFPYQAPATPPNLFWDPHAANLLSSLMCSNVINDVHAKTINLVNKIFQVISYVIQNLCVRERRPLHHISPS